MLKFFLKITWFLSLANFFIPIHGNGEGVSQWNQARVEEGYATLKMKEKVKFHRTLMMALERQALTTQYEQSKIEVYTTYHSNLFVDLLIQQAHASMDDKTVRCQFGGWMTSIKNSKCAPPWKRSVRDDSSLDKFGGKYAHSCGGANLFRCNPIIFGPGEDGHGICTTTDDNDPNLATSSCLEDFNKDPVSAREHVKRLADNPEMLSQYLAITVETMRFCEVQESPFSYCSQLNQYLESSSKSAVSCAVQEDLISFLPVIMTPFNEDELDALTNGLGTKAKEYMEQLEERQLSALRHNREVFETAIKAAQADQRLIDTIERAKTNTTRCLREMCEGTGYSKSKPSSKSIAFCAAYVKHALFPYNGDKGRRFANFSEYPWGDDAVESAPWLEKQGFVNILDYPSMSNITPENAPDGAIIVYEKTSGRKNYTVNGKKHAGPGHIEIKASDKEYISDFINDEPTRIGGLRRPIGIYYKLPSEYKKQLQEIPEI